MYSGTSGLVLPVPNKASFPVEFQEKSRLTYYASLFNSIEINSSFKKVPMGRTVEKWAASVPEHFRFTFKMPKAVTHQKGLQFDPGDIRHFMQVISAAGNKKGALLLQFPGKLSMEYADQLKNLLTGIRKEDPLQEWRMALEFRHPAWYTQNTYDMLQVYHASIVRHDMPGSVTPDSLFVGEVVYLRFHGTEKGYRGSYSSSLLDKYAKQIKAWSQAGKRVYVYFNNTLGDAAQNALTLNRLVGS